MEFTNEDFDLDRLKRFEEKEILQTTNFSTIQQLCKQAQRFSNMMVILAETGYGKSSALEYYANNNENVIYITVQQAMTSKVLYGAILKAAGWKNIYRESSLYNIMESIGYFLKNSPGKKLLIFDEGNHISDINLVHLHDLRNATEHISGIIVAGPKQLQTRLNYLESITKYGIPEFLRRVFSWDELDPPTKIEKIQLYKVHGFKNEAIIMEYAKDDLTLDDVYKNIQRIGMLYLSSIGEL